MTAAKRILIVGAGGRVTDAVLPVLARARERYELAGVFARKEREVDARGVTHRVRPLATLTAEEVAATDIVYLVVAKPAVGAVLAQLARFDVTRVDLLLETPVVLFRNLHHVRRVRPFRSASVAEDLSALPWLEPLRAAYGGSLGAPSALSLDRSGYAYHGVALAKAILGARVVTSGRRRSDADGELRTLRLSSGAAVEWRSPRDYARGSVTVRCAGGVVSDKEGDGDLHLRPVLAGERCVGVAVGDDERLFDDDEAALCFGADPRASLTARMQDLKRVGLLRLLRRMHTEGAAYPLQDALDDMLVDYHLEKAGVYRANPLTSARGALRPMVEAALSFAARLRRSS